MSNQSLPQNWRSIHTLLTGLVVGAFAKSCTMPSWSSALEFVAVLILVGYVVWLNPTRRLEVTREEFNKLHERCALVQEQLTATRFKIGMTK